MTYISTKMNIDIQIDSIVTIHYFEYMKDFVFHGESHNFWELLYVDKGTVSVRADDTWHSLSAGDVIFHKPNEFHAFESVGEKAPNLVAISFYSSSPDIYLFSHLHCTLTLEERILISKIIAEAREAFSTPLYDPSVEQVLLSDSAPFGSQQLIKLYLELFLITLKRSHLNGLPRKSVGLPVITSSSDLVANPTLCEQLCSYLGEHICDHLTVTDICDAFSISRSVLQALFHKEKGCGVIEYFNGMKIQYAKDIIRDGTMNFTEIAYFLSYSSLQYFSKQFKKATGMSPLEYASSVKGISQSLKGSKTEKRDR